MNDLSECYRILELAPGASFEEVERAYQELLTVWQPDRFQGNPELHAKAGEKLQQINLAYQWLCAAQAAADEAAVGQSAEASPEEWAGEESVAEEGVAGEYVAGESFAEEVATTDLTDGALPEEPGDELRAAVDQRTTFSRARFPRWIWAASGLAVLITLGVVFTQRQRTPPAQQSAASADVNTGTGPAATPTGARAAGPAISGPTAEQAASTVRVRVASGGLPPQEYTGALLHRDELKEFPMMQGKHRCVLALLKGWTGAQLRGGSCKIFVMRNPPEGQAAARENLRPARLLQFDEASGLAALDYMESFEASADGGYRIERQAFAGSKAGVVRTFSASGAQPLGVEPGQAEISADSAATLHFPPAEGAAERDAGPAVVAAPATLIGFVGDEKPTAKVATLREFKLALETPMLKPTGIGFGVPQSVMAGAATTEMMVGIAILTESENPALKPQRTTLYAVAAPKEPDLSAALGAASTRRIDGKVIQTMMASPTKPNEWPSRLAAPEKEGEERVYLLQLGWPAFPNDREDAIFSRPFLVTLRYQGGKVVPTVQGLRNLNERAAAAASQTAKFPLEAAVVDLHEIAGGREVLMQLDGPPFWKRFSMTKNAWLPLPAGILANCYVTGNLDAIFVLDRGAAEIRKYSLADLRPVVGTKLAVGHDYVAVLAGCNSARAPLYLLTKDDHWVLSCDTLQRRDMAFALGEFARQRRASETKFSLEYSHQCIGDGLGFFSWPRGDTGRKYALGFVNDAVGLKGFNFNNFLEGGACVATTYGVNPESGGWMWNVLTPDGKRETTKAPASNPGFYPYWGVPNSPAVCRLAIQDSRDVPARESRLELFSYFDSSPFAEVEVPERSANLPGEKRKQRGLLAFDPYSLRMGVLSLDGKMWQVHPATVVPNRTQPVLLNWPDSSVHRGAVFRFKPLLLGGEKFTAELAGQKEPLKVENGEITFTAPQNESAAVMMLTLRVPGKDGELAYKIPLNFADPSPPIAARVGELPRSPGAKGTPPAPADTGRNLALPLSASVHALATPVQDVLGPVAGHLVLAGSSGKGSLKGSRVDLFSLQTKKVVASSESPEKASYYALADGVFEYNTERRSLTRLSVPGLRREQTMTLPNGMTLHAIGLGTAATSPLTLVLQEIQGRSVEQFDNFTVTTTRFERNAVVLDNRTLQASGWGQPKLVGWKEGAGNPYQFGSPSVTPLRLPTSHSGQFVNLPGAFLALGRSLSVTSPFTDALGGMNMARRMGLFRADPTPPTGSISGAIVGGSNGVTFKGGIGDEFSNREASFCSATPCGRYRLVGLPQDGEDESNPIEVRTIENDARLFHLGRLASFRNAFGQANRSGQDWRWAQMLGDNGPLVILAGTGKLLEIVDCDIPRLAKELLPSAFHVTSQAPACVAEGGVLEYQVAVNNPAAVAAIKLRDETPGATISPQGLLRYTAPAKVSGTTRMTLCVRLDGKDGQTVLHEFPFFVLPLQQQAPVKPGAATPPPIPGVRRL